MTRNNIKDNPLSKKRTICEVHREIYTTLLQEFEESPSRQMLEKKLEEAYHMAKKMNSKLRQYKHNYDDDWWEQEQKEIAKEKYKLRQELYNRKK